MNKACSMLLILLCMIFVLSACANLNPLDSTTKGNTEKELTVYYLSKDTAATFIVRGYKPEDATVKINAVAFNSAAEMDLRLSTEAGSGKGADVVLFPSATTLDTAKMAINNAFLDLTPYLSSDGSFDPANYYPVLDAGKVGGKQALMPLRFRPQYLLTSEEKLTNAGIALSEKYSASELMSALAANAANCAEGESAIQCLYSGAYVGILYDTMRLANVQIADMNSKTLTVSDDTFRVFSEYAKMAYGQIQKSEQILKLYSRDFVGGVSKLTTMLSVDPLPFQMRYYEALFDQALEEKLEVLAMPNHEDAGALTVDVGLYAAVLQSTDCPKEAYAFVRYAMDSAAGDVTNTLPVSKSAVTAVLDELCAQAGKRVNIGSMFVNIPVMSDELRASCEELLGRIDSGNIRNCAVSDIFAESMQGYITGESTFEECYETFKNRMNLYLYE